MTTGVKCLEYARECAHRAKLVSNPELRERLFNIARNWTERATREPSDTTARTQADVGVTGSDQHYLAGLPPLTR